VRWAVVAGNIDHRCGDPLFHQVTAQIDSRSVTQVDVNDQANCVAEINVTEESLYGVEQEHAQSMSSEQSPDARPHRRVVINDENGLASRQNEQPSGSN
jgi:hypothetical protein